MQVETIALLRGRRWWSQKIGGLRIYWILIDFGRVLPLDGYAVMLERDEPDWPWIGTQRLCGNTYKALFKASISVHVGQGDKAKLWHSSRWLNGRTPMNLAPNLYPLAWRKNQLVKGWSS
jgi:hypothetical protein